MPYITVAQKCNLEARLQIFPEDSRKLERVLKDNVKLSLFFHQNLEIDQLDPSPNLQTARSVLSCRTSCDDRVAVSHAAQAGGHRLQLID